MVLAFILYTYVALELCMLLKDVNDGSRISDQSESHFH